jgi:hypothetical protein
MVNEDHEKTDRKQPSDFYLGRIRVRIIGLMCLGCLRPQLPQMKRP